MIVDLARARSVRAMIAFRPEPLGWSLRHGFAGLPPLLQIAALQGHALPTLWENASAIRDDLVSMVTLMARLQWQLELRLRDELNLGIWDYFSRLDVEYFFVVFRSAFDHIGACLQALSRKPGQAPPKFGDLRSYARTDRGPAILGPDICDLLSDCEWFEVVRDLRDRITHRGAWALTFPDADTIPFQVYDGPFQRVRMPELMYNENVADFRRLAALLLAYFVLLLEQLDQLVRCRLGLLPHGPEAYMGGPGTETFKGWLDALLAFEGHSVAHA